MKKQININTLWLTFAIAFSLVSCERRELECDLNQAALIPVSIDWSVSEVSVPDMHRASVILFPKDGGKPLEYRLEGDLNHKDIEIPVGSYSVVVFNETTDLTDWSGIEFSGTDQYNTFAAYVKPETQKGFYISSPEHPLGMNPDPLAAWHLDDFEVTSDMVAYTCTKEKQFSQAQIDVLEEAISALSNVQPQPYIQHVNIIVW